MFNRVVLVVILVPLAVVLVALAVANRAAVAFTVDPFNPGNPALTVSLPFFIFLFAALAVGMVVGGVVTWFRQGRYRKLARRHRLEAEGLRQAAVSRAPQAPASSGPALPKPSN